MSEGSKFNFGKLIWIIVIALFAYGIYYILNAPELPEVSGEH